MTKGTTTTVPTTCTVVVTATGGTCGAPAVVTLPGGRFAECVEHAPAGAAPAAPARVAAATLGLRTATTRPYVLVAAGAIVGYAETITPAVAKRAARLGARVVPVR